MTLYCSFCGKKQEEVEKLIAGPTVFICNECVDLCKDLCKQKEGPLETIDRVVRRLHSKAVVVEKVRRRTVDEPLDRFDRIERRLELVEAYIQRRRGDGNETST